MNPPPETPTPPDWLEEVLDAISCTDGVNDHRWSTDKKGKIIVELDYGNETLSFEADTDGEMHGANFDNVIYDMTDSEAVQFWCAGELYTRLQKAKEPKPTEQKEWYEFYESIIFIPPGQVPQTKGGWKDSDYTEAMIPELKQHYPGAQLIVVSSRCGNIDATDADEWLEMRKIGREIAENEAAYVEAGICSDCGACNATEAESKCKPHAVGDTGDYTCAGECLWQDEPTHRPRSH